MKAGVIIVGAGHGGAQAAVALRAAGFIGSIVMIGREPEPPYERPPLSKEYLAGEKAFDRLYIRAPQFWADKNVTLILNREVVEIDPVAHTVTLGDGDTIGYGKLIWAAGGDPRLLSCKGADLEGVHSVRTRKDVDQLIAELEAGARNAVVVGGGYIGLEAAAVLKKLGCEVTLLEAMSRVLARVAGIEISHFYEANHRALGVDIRTNVTVDELLGDRKVTGVRLGDGTVLLADLVIVGIGIIPAVEPLVRAGADGANGVLVDSLCRTSLPDIFAIGDCAAFACDFADGQVLRVESVQNANDMAICAAKVICGVEEPYHALPWFWSNQYDLKLQTAGLSIGYDQTIVRGDPETRSFSVIYLKNGRIIALDCVNNAKDYVQGRKAIESRIAPDPVRLADAQIALTDL